MNFIIQENFQIFSQLRYNSKELLINNYELIKNKKMKLDKLFPKDLYHSYVVEGKPIETMELLFDFLKERENIDRLSPDILCQSYESFNINNSREIKDWYNKKGISGNKKICIIATQFINKEAEQSLLKIIEEPTANTHFFIIVPDSSLLLETILSRVHLIKIRSNYDVVLQKRVQKLISSTPKERIEMVAIIIKENKEEESSGKLRSYGISIINELENIFYQKFKKMKTDKKIIFILKELEKSRKYLSSPGASVKMILEHIVLVI